MNTALESLARDLGSSLNQDIYNPSRGRNYTRVASCQRYPHKLWQQWVRWLVGPKVTKETGQVVKVQLKANIKRLQNY